MNDSRKIEFDPNGGDELISKNGTKYRVIGFANNEVCCCRHDGLVCVFSQARIIDLDIHIISRRPLGVYDKNGNEWRDGDEMETSMGRKLFVFNAIKSTKIGAKSSIIVKDESSDTGWTRFKAENFEIIRDGKKLKKEEKFACKQCGELRTGAEGGGAPYCAECWNKHKHNQDTC